MSSTLTIRNLDDVVKQKLRMQAAMHGRSMEAEAREILTRDVLQSATEARISIIPPATGKFDGFVGIWKGRMTTDEIMEVTRGD